LRLAAVGDTHLVGEPEERHVEGTDKAVPPETLEKREQMGRQLGLLWVGIFAVAAIVIALVAWLVA
jgi:hypothetical protein